MWRRAGNLPSAMQCSSSATYCVSQQNKNAKKNGMPQVEWVGNIDESGMVWKMHLFNFKWEFKGQNVNFLYRVMSNFTRQFKVTIKHVAWGHINICGLYLAMFEISCKSACKQALLLHVTCLFCFDAAWRPRGPCLIWNAAGCEQEVFRGSTWNQESKITTA